MSDQTNTAIVPPIWPGDIQHMLDLFLDKQYPNDNTVEELTWHERQAVEVLTKALTWVKWSKPAIESVLRLHSERKFTGDGYGWSVCAECRQTWPCETVQGLDSGRDANSLRSVETPDENASREDS